MENLLRQQCIRAEIRNIRDIIFRIENKPTLEKINLLLEIATNLKELFLISED